MSNKVPEDTDRKLADAGDPAFSDPANATPAPSWAFDTTQCAKADENRIEVLVCSTLENHYTTIPTHYRKYQREDQAAGLIGPVRVLAEEQSNPSR